MTLCPTTRQTAFIWVLHGSHDPQYQATIAALEQQLSTQLDDQCAWAIAWLECAETSLSEQIQQWAMRWQAEGIERIEVVPVFLLPGVHVMEDIPAQVAAAQTKIDVEIYVQPYLGSQPVLAARLGQRLAGSPPQARLLVAHGTRRANGNQPIEALAQRLDATTAYWFVSPSLRDRITALYAQGQRCITVLPYVLVSGALTDGIDQQLEELQAELVDLKCDRLAALDASLLDLILAGLASD